MKPLLLLIGLTFFINALHGQEANPLYSIEGLDQLLGNMEYDLLATHTSQKKLLFTTWLVTFIRQYVCAAKDAKAYAFLATSLAKRMA